MPELVPFCDLTRALGPIRDEIDAAMRRTVDSGWFLRGPEVEAFEAEWADYCGQAHAVCCNSGTDALTIAALALGLRHAVVQANTLPLTAIGLLRGGSTVSLAEVDADGRLARPAPDAVPVLLYGRPPESQEMGARLFDAAHAHGWRPPGAAAAAWSFYPTKTLGALGDGGAVTTNDEHLAAEMRKLCSRDDVMHDPRQITSRMDELQAAVLRAKLRHLDRWLAERREIGHLYDTRLAVRAIKTTGASLNHLYVIRVTGRDALAHFLSRRGIGCKVHWPQGLHRQEGAWARDGAFSSTDAWCDSVLSLPCFPGLRPDEIERVCEAVLTWMDHHARTPEA